MCLCSNIKILCISNGLFCISNIRIVLKINPLAVHSILESIAAEEEEGDVNFQEEEEGGPHSLKDVCDIRRPEPSPFSSRRVMFENEEVL